MQFDAASMPPGPSPASIRRLAFVPPNLKHFFRRETTRALLILLAILNIDFFPCIWGHKTLLESAQFSQSVLATGSWEGKHLPSVRLPTMLDPAAAAWVTETFPAVTGSEYLKTGTLPLWNPYQGFGAPYAANGQSQPFYPLSLLFALDVTPKTYNLFLLSRLFLLGTGAYLFLRLFVSFIPAITGGTAAMLSGYFLLVISTPYLSVETLIPLGLFAAELVLRRPARSTISLFALVSALAILGGMPESTVLLYLFVYCYAAWRIAFDPDLRHRWLKRSVSIVAGTAIGVCFSAFLLLPMVEYIHHSYNAHEPGKNGGTFVSMWHERLDQSILTYLFPLLLGPPFAPTLSPFNYNGNGARNYFGAIAFFLVLAALLSTHRPRAPAARRLRPLTFFFFICAVLVILYRYGCPIIGDAGRLPVLRLIALIKYDEPILSVCIAVLCGIGLEEILTRSATRRVQIVALAIAFSTIPAAVLYSRHVLVKELWTDHVGPEFPLIAIGLPVCLLFLLALFYIATNDTASPDGDAARRAVSLSICVFVLLTAELSLNYIPELYYSFSHLPDVTENPYAGAPYIRWLQTNDLDRSRVFGRGGALYPDWASVFHLADIRDLDALYYWKYLPFIRNFLLSSGEAAETEELADRFTGNGAYSYAFASASQRRLLQLSSARYLVTNAPYPEGQFQLSYNSEVKIYRYDAVLPRAALYFRANVLDNDTGILHHLTSPEFDPFQTVLLNASQLRPEEFREISAVNNGSALPVAAARIVSYAPQAVEIEALLPQPGVLMLNDSDYPGWRVSVDGKPNRMLSADFLFRGVLLPAGRHRIRFSYRSRAFMKGAAITGFTLAAWIFWYSGLAAKALERARRG